MKAEFWHQRWQNNHIGFHKTQVNPLLQKHWQTVSQSLKVGSRIFIPLCGKTRDIAWFCSQGYHVIGVELSEIAIQQLFAERGDTPQITASGAFVHYQTDRLDIWVGDIFELNAQQIGKVDMIYDRAALVALPPAMRLRYTQQLVRLTACAPQLLLTYDYDQTQKQGPPFAVPATELQAHYQAHYRLIHLADMTVMHGLATEQVWQLRSRIT